VPARVSATDRIHTKIDALFAEDRELPEILEGFACLGAQLLMQAALEAEVTEFLGGERYQCATTGPDANAGSRNGYRPVTVKTTRPGHVGAAETPRHHRSVRIAAVRQARDENQRPRNAGDRLVRPRAVGARRASHPRRSTRRSGRDLEVDGLRGL
jgi:hypothetical protein